MNFLFVFLFCKGIYFILLKNLLKKKTENESIKIINYFIISDNQT